MNPATESGRNEPGLKEVASFFADIVDQVSRRYSGEMMLGPLVVEVEGTRRIMIWDSI
jgi:hypothetical protein